MALFAFELRYYDAQQAKEENGRPDYYTKKLLSYKVITSPIWEAIITSNHFSNTNLPDEKFPRMIVDPKVQFKLNLGEPIFRCEDKGFAKEAGHEEKPVVTSMPNEKLLEQVKSKNFFRRVQKYFQTNSEDKTELWNLYKKMWAGDYDKGTDTVQF